VAGKKVHLKATAYGTACYPSRLVEKEISIATLPNAVLCNPRNGYQNYNCAVNLTNKTIYTYMGALKPRAGNANYCSAGELSPLFNDPYYKAIGLGTRIFLGGGTGITGTEHSTSLQRKERKGVLVTCGHHGLWTGNEPDHCSGRSPGLWLLPVGRFPGSYSGIE
jgi:uncharacterized protein (DUF39 family)